MGFSLRNQSRSSLSRSSLAALVLSVCYLFINPLAEAQHSQEEAHTISPPSSSGSAVAGKTAKKALPKSGVLSETSTSGWQSKAVGLGWGQETGQEVSPLSGSVSKMGRDWQARLFNNSEDLYSASVRVVQLDERGGQVKSDSFTARLKGGESYDRTFSGTDRSVNARFVLESWKNLSPKRGAPPEGAATPSVADESSVGTEAHSIR